MDAIRPQGRRPSWAPEPPPSSWQSPVCARWADELHVFQRTPSSVDERDQRRTNAQEWRQMTLTKGWWRAGTQRKLARQAGRQAGHNAIQDRWERIHDQTCRHLTGGRAARAAHRGADTRARPPGPSQRPPLNSAPKAWYPIWRKRPRRGQVVYLTGRRSTRPWAHADRAISTTRAARGPCPPGRGADQGRDSRGGASTRLGYWHTWISRSAGGRKGRWRV